VCFRIATAEIYTADTHRFTPVLTQPPAEYVAKAREAGKEAKWPQVMWAICQDDRIFLNTGPDGEPVKGDYEAGYGDCRIKHYFAGKKGRYDRDLTKCDRLTYVLVVLQDATMEGSKLLGLKDRTEKWTNKEGTEVTVPAIRYMAQFYRSVFSPMVNTVNLGSGELEGSSWMVKRDGKDYTVSPVSGAKASTGELDACAATLQMMEFSLGDFILSHAAADHYDRFWGDGTGTAAPSADGNGTTAEPDAAQAAPLDPQAELNVQNFAEKLSTQAKGAGAQPAEALSIG
jgi:hypothetical protein